MLLIIGNREVTAACT